jgi:hypothetical protein
MSPIQIDSIESIPTLEGGKERRRKRGRNLRSRKISAGPRYLSLSQVLRVAVGTTFFVNLGRFRTTLFNNIEQGRS